MEGAMKFGWATNLYDRDGDEYEECVLVFCNDSIILKFENMGEMVDFANEMLRCLPEMREANES
jgi:hypothetical protein